MCGMRHASALNFKTSLPHHALFQERITDRFMARKMLSAGAGADARNKIVEIIKTNCHGHWTQLAAAFQNKSNGSHPQTHQMERVPTVATTELREISRTVHVTQSWIGWNSRVRIKTYTMITLEGALHTFCADCKICSKPRCSCWQN